MAGSGLKIPPGSTTATTDAIRAHGEVKVRTGVLWLVGIISGILTVGGLLAFFFRPDEAKDIWVIIGPIITAGVAGSVAFLSGGRSKS
jgi:hypothetical protein